MTSPQRDDLPAPATAVELYLHDIALSMRILTAALVKLTMDVSAAVPTQPAAEITPLREPSKGKGR